MKIKIVSATKAKTESEFLQRPLAKSLDKLKRVTSDLEWEIVFDNKEGLSILYNRFLDNKENAGKMLVFVHDDVVIEDLFFAEKLSECSWPIIGLAGTKSFNFSSPKLAWFTASVKGSDFVGEVAHSDKGVCWTTVFGPTPSSALIIDGLFIAVNFDIVHPTPVRFDPHFNWHFYDVAFCIRAYRHGLKVGITNIRVIHHSLGYGFFSSEWKTANEKFRELYCEKDK